MCKPTHAGDTASKDVALPVILTVCPQKST